MCTFTSRPVSWNPRTGDILDEETALHITTILPGGREFTKWLEANGMPFWSYYRDPA